MAKNKNQKSSKRASGRQTLRNLTKNLEKTEYKGVTFTFDDEELQEAYIQQTEKYRVLEIDWFEPVTYNVAKSITNKDGKMQKELSKLLDRYEKEDHDYVKGSLHKDKIYEKVRSQYSNLTPLQQVQKLNAFFDLVEEETKKWNDNHKKNNGQQKYNIVYYDQSNKGSHSPV